jgi:hypothetical protein
MPLPLRLWTLRFGAAIAKNRISGKPSEKKKNRRFRNERRSS